MALNVSLYYSVEMSDMGCVCVYERDLGGELESVVVKTAAVRTSLMTCFMSSEVWRATVGASLSVKNDCS